MHFLSILATAAAIFDFSAASPLTASDIKGKKTFTLQQVLTSNATIKTPAQKLLNAYAKYAKVGASAPSAVQKAAASATVAASVLALPEAYDVSYLCPVNVGGKTLNLNFDTGSADLWVYSSLQPGAQRSGHAYYNAKASNLMNGYSWAIEYGDSSGASGKVYADRVIVGSATATAQAVEAATSVSASFLADGTSDGLLGLASSSINTISPISQTTFFDTVKLQLANPVFTADLKKGLPGSYDFGYIDQAKHSGAITYVNLTSSNNGFWQILAAGYVIGSAAKVTRQYPCVVDTGTSLLLLPSWLVSAYYKALPYRSAVYSSYQGGWVFPCTTKLPSLSLLIGTQLFTLPGTYLNYANLGSGLCFGGLQADNGIGFSVLGDVFLKSQFVVFAQSAAGVKQVGFAAKKLVA